MSHVLIYETICASESNVCIYAYVFTCSCWFEGNITPAGNVISWAKKQLESSRTRALARLAVRLPHCIAIPTRHHHHFRQTLLKNHSHYETQRITSP